jgi:glyoxylase-like metal-dependent hydrolase (beta-lactamase superfamily II)
VREAAVVLQRSQGSEGRVIPLSLRYYNVYFIRTDGGYILVDTGMPGDSRALQKTFSKAGLKPQDVKLIIITHAHVDHVGSVAYAKRVTGADVLCHESAAPFIRAGKSSPVVAYSLLSKLLSAISPSKYKPVEPDIVVTDKFDLRDFGIAGQVIHTPGHTQGSVTVLLESGEMLLGDMVRGTGVDIHIGSFYEDKKALLQNLEKLAACGANKIYMSHGDVTDSETLQQSIEAIDR